MSMTAGGAVKPAPKPAPTKSASTPAPPKPSAPSKFSVLEYINRDPSDAAKAASPETTKPNQNKKRKHVSWPPDSALEQIKMIENITINYAEDLFWQTPQEFGNARDLDIGEGGAFRKDTVEDEEEIEWYEPKCNPLSCRD
jgi:hypothetical protein